MLQAISLASSQGPDTEQDLMAVLLSVLIQEIAPRLSAAPALRELAVKLVTQIASGSMSATFKAVAAKLSPQHKLRLQVRGFIVLSTHSEYDCRLSQGLWCLLTCNVLVCVILCI